MARSGNGMCNGGYTSIRLGSSLKALLCSASMSSVSLSSAMIFLDVLGLDDSSDFSYNTNGYFSRGLVQCEADVSVCNVVTI